LRLDFGIMSFFMTKGQCFVEAHPRFPS
jgi:hypothetical protein